jgi:hypothetical protein
VAFVVDHRDGPGLRHDVLSQLDGVWGDVAGSWAFDLALAGGGLGTDEGGEK